MPLTISPLAIGIIASATIAAEEIKQQNGVNKYQLENKIFVSGGESQNIQNLVTLSSEELIYFDGSLPLSKEQISFINNYNRQTLYEISQEIKDNKTIKVVEIVKKEIVDNYFNKGFFNPSSFKLVSGNNLIDYPEEAKEIIKQGDVASYLTANKKVIELWKSGKFEIPWGFRIAKIVKNDKSQIGTDLNQKQPTIGSKMSFSSSQTSFPIRVLLTKKSDKSTIEIPLNDIHSFVYQKQPDEKNANVLGEVRRVNTTKKGNFAFLNKIYNETETRKEDFNVYAINAQERSLISYGLNGYNYGQAGFIVLRRKPRSLTTLGYDFTKTFNSFYPNNIKHYYLPLEDDEYQAKVEYAKTTIATSLASSSTVMPKTLILKTSDGQEIDVTSKVQYIVYNKKASDTDENNIAVTRSFNERRFRYLNFFIKDGQDKGRNNFNNVSGNAKSNQLVKSSTIGVAPETSIGIVFDASIKALLPTKISLEPISGFWPEDTEKVYASTTGSGYSIMFQVPDVAKTKSESGKGPVDSAKTSKTWYIGNVDAALKSKVKYDGQKLNQTYMLVYKPTGKMEKDQLGEVIFGKTWSLKGVKYWASKPNKFEGTTGNGKRNNEKFSVNPAHQEKIRALLKDAEEEIVKILFVEPKSLKKETADLLPKIKIFKENKGDKKQAEYVIVTTDDPKLTVD